MPEETAREQCGVGTSPLNPALTQAAQMLGLGGSLTSAPTAQTLLEHLPPPPAPSPDAGDTGASSLARTLLSDSQHPADADGQTKEARKMSDNESVMKKVKIMAGGWGG